MSERGHESALLEAAQSAALDHLAVSVVGLLRSRNIEALLLRGPVLSRRLYGPGASRPYSDVDLLVPPERFEAAEAALAELGLRQAALEVAFPLARPHHAHTWVASGGRMVDLHRTLVGAEAPPETVWRLLRDGATAFELEGVEVLVPSDAGLALTVALHVAHHVDRASKPVEDLERALERFPAGAWASAARLAEEVGASETFAAGLQLSAAGRTLLGRLALVVDGPRASPLPSGERSFHVAQGLLWLRQTRGTRARAAFLRERLLPSPRTMRRRSRLANRGPAGLALAYAGRWLDAVLRLPAALFGLRRARR